VPYAGVDVSLRTPVEFDARGMPRAAAPDDKLPAGAVGEICVRGDNVFAGYIGGATAGGLLVRDGWLHTGDLGERRHDGPIVFRGLVKPMFTRSGFNVYPREIERVVVAMPGVQGARIRAIPEPTREHDIELTVVGDVAESDVRRWCEQRLASYKRPSVIRLSPS